MSCSIRLTLASEWDDESQKPYFICEVLAPKKTLIRELAASCYQKNNLRSLQAVENYIWRIEESQNGNRRASSQEILSLPPTSDCSGALATKS